MRKIYIAKNARGESISIVLAPSLSLAQAYWLGANLHVISYEEIDPSLEFNEGYEVRPLLKTRNNISGPTETTQVMK